MIAMDRAWTHSPVSGSGKASPDHIVGTEQHRGVLPRLGMSIYPALLYPALFGLIRNFSPVERLL